MENQPPPPYLTQFPSKPDNNYIAKITSNNNKTKQKQKSPSWDFRLKTKQIQKERNFTNKIHTFTCEIKRREWRAETAKEEKLP